MSNIFSRFYFFLSACLFSLFCFSQSAVANNEVIVYNWFEYIPDKVIKDFEKETGIKVIYSTFKTNEEMLRKIKMLRGKLYDVVVPSTDYVEMFAREGWIQPLDLSKIPNLKNIHAQFLNKPFDPNNAYSVPYMWGSVGLVYNTKYIPKGSITKWSQLDDPKLKKRIVMTLDMRDAMGLALRSKGYSINSQNKEEIKEAYQFLMKIRPYFYAFDVKDTKDLLISETAWIGPIWNGDFLVVKEDKPELEFIFPDDGTVVWMDNFVIPKEAQNVENAYKFINYMLRPDVAVECIKEFKYSSPNKRAVSSLPIELKTNRILLPNNEFIQNNELTTGVGKARVYYEKYWKILNPR